MTAASPADAAKVRLRAPKAGTVVVSLVSVKSAKRPRVRVVRRGMKRGSVAVWAVSKRKRRGRWTVRVVGGRRAGGGATIAQLENPWELDVTGGTPGAPRSSLLDSEADRLFSPFTGTDGFGPVDGITIGGTTDVADNGFFYGIGPLDTTGPALSVFRQPLPPLFTATPVTLPPNEASLITGILTFQRDADPQDEIGLVGPTSLRYLPNPLKGSTQPLTGFNGTALFGTGVGSRPDLVLGTAGGLFYGGISGPFGAVPGAGPLVSGDFNNDGVEEVVGESVRIDHQVLVPAPGGYTPHAVGDFDGDGRLDLAGLQGGQPAVVLGLGNRTFGAPIRLPGTFAGDIRIAAGNLDGDGRTDLAVGTTARISLYPAKDGGFATGPTVDFTDKRGTNEWRGSTRLFLEDIDGDRRDDVSAHRPGYVRYWSTVSFPAISTPRTLLTGPSSVGVVVGRFNADAFTDLGALDPFNGTFTVFTGTGRGVFTPPGSGVRIGLPPILIGGTPTPDPTPTATATTDPSPQPKTFKVSGTFSMFSADELAFDLQFDRRVSKFFLEFPGRTVTNFLAPQGAQCSANGARLLCERLYWEAGSGPSGRVETDPPPRFGFSYRPVVVEDETEYEAQSTITGPPVQCSDGVDNDADGMVDLLDFGCERASDDSEATVPSCNSTSSIFTGSAFGTTFTNAHRVAGSCNFYFDHMTWTLGQGAQPNGNYGFGFSEQISFTSGEFRVVMKTIDGNPGYQFDGAVEVTPPPGSGRQVLIRAFRGAPGQPGAVYHEFLATIP